MARNSDQQEVSAVRRTESAEVETAEKSNVRSSTKQFDMEALATAPGSSGPSYRPKEKPIQVEAVEVAAEKAKPDSKVKHIASEVLARAPGTSGPSGRHTATLEVTRVDKND